MHHLIGRARLDRIGHAIGARQGGQLVTGLSRRPPRPEACDAHIAHDLTRPLPPEAGRFDVVVHCAALASPWASPRAYEDANILGLPIGSTIVTLCLLMFAFTTILGWGFYGQQGAVYMFGPRAAKPYLIVFLLCTFFGAAVLDIASTIREGVKFIWVIADISTAAMMLPNLFGLVMMGGTVKRLAFDYIRHTRTGKPLAHKPFHFTAGPAKAVAKISMRLVPGMEPAATFAKFKSFVQSIAPAGVEVEVRMLHSGDPCLVRVDNPYIQAATHALHEVWGKDTVFIRSGGSIPIVGDFDRHLGIPSVMMGFGLPDDNLHAPNEKFHLENFRLGIQSLIRFLEEAGK